VQPDPAGAPASPTAVDALTADRLAEEHAPVGEPEPVRDDARTGHPPARRELAGQQPGAVDRRAVICPPDSSADMIG
jgi:hypothetical protein